jgi:alpha-L-rhamnosidase
MINPEYKMINTNDWTASWIGIKEESLENQWICFRKKVVLNETLSRGMVRIACDSKYWLWVNGSMIVFEGQLKRGPDPENTYYDEIDLSGALQKGDNTITILLWYFGKQGYSHKSSGRAGLIFDSEYENKSLNSNSSWKSRLHPSFGKTRWPHPNFRLSESNVHFDAGKEEARWQQPDFDDSHWPDAIDLGNVPCKPWNKLILRPIPQWRDSGLKEYVKLEYQSLLNGGTRIKAHLPYNAQITPYLKIDSPPGKTIKIRTELYWTDIEGNIRSEYISKKGPQEFESPGWMNGHVVYYSIPRGVTVHSLMYRETGYDCDFTGSFTCDDEFFNRYRMKALRTLYLNMRDTYFDCPDRERAQWWGDVVTELGEAFYALDSRSTLLTRKAILELLHWQRKDKTLFSPIPAGKDHKELPMQMLASVGWYGIWTYFLYSGDLDTLKTVYPGIKKYLSVWMIGDDGLVVPRKGGWTWGDWGRHKDMGLLYNGWYYLALKGVLNMALTLNDEEELPLFREKMRSIESNFNKTFWTGEEYRSPGYKGKTDDRGQALAVVSGLAGSDKYEMIRGIFKSSFYSSPYMEKYVGEALYRMGHASDALSRTKKRFKKMIDHPGTTLWELWRTFGGTTNHGWSGGGLTLQSQYGLGVAPTKPGYEEYSVLPQMGYLRHITGTIPSVKGEISVELHREDHSFSLDLISPPGTVATVGIPRQPGEAVRELQVNGNAVYVQGEFRSGLQGLSFLNESEEYILFKVDAGQWSFKK